MSEDSTYRTWEMTSVQSRTREEVGDGGSIDRRRTVSTNEYQRRCVKKEMQEDVLTDRLIDTSPCAGARSAILTSFYYSMIAGSRDLH